LIEVLGTPPENQDEITAIAIALKRIQVSGDRDNMSAWTIAMRHEDLEIDDIRSLRRPLDTGAAHPARGDGFDCAPSRLRSG
jgi:hypothetical protein